MVLDIFQVDAFAENVFEGNPAAVCPLEHWLADEVLQKIAEENNLSETAFLVANNTDYELRWFTPEDEVDLCGHATLAAAHVIFTHLAHKNHLVRFKTRSGELIVEKKDNGYLMNFPATFPEQIDIQESLTKAIGIEPQAVYAGFDYIAVLENETQLKAVKPDFAEMGLLDKRGVVITAPGDNCDFVSRCFYPKLRVDEDPVTGSAHCQLAPYWQSALSKTKFIARQLSKRTGVVRCEVIGDRVILIGDAVDYMKGQISI